MEQEEINEEEDDFDDPEIQVKTALDSSVIAMK